jgi:hypothetical protein
MSKRTVVTLAIVATGAWWLLACMPGLFSHLPASGQVAVYGMRLRIIPVPASSLRAVISRHGLAAVPKLLAQVSGREHELPRAEAIEILWVIQLRGCDLSHSDVPVVVQQLLSSGHLTVIEQTAAVRCLEAIHENQHFPPGAFDRSLSPCEPSASRPTLSTELRSQVQ